MEDQAFRTIEVVGTSDESQDAAIANAIAAASKTTRDLSWFEVVESRGAIKQGAVAQHQVTVKIGYRVHPGQPADHAAQ